MDMTGEQLIPQTQEVTWRALNDTQVLKACIPGCESIEQSGDNAYDIVMTAKVGPVSAKFKGKMTLADIVAPQSYRITFEGQGGVAGFAKGEASVNLAPQDGGTRLSYEAHAMIGGKLAQIGSRLIDGVAKKIAGEFFAKFNELVSSGGR
jgi:carbon monoxide dehydrogenase subunit G